MELIALDAANVMVLTVRWDLKREDILHLMHITHMFLIFNLIAD
jgi:hypothetical protein